MELHNKMLQGDLKDRIKSGIMIIGPNSSDGTLSTWHANNEERAVELATHFSETTGDCYEIIKYEFLGVVRPTKLPTEYYKPEPKQV